MNRKGGPHDNESRTAEGRPGEVPGLFLLSARRGCEMPLRGMRLVAVPLWERPNPRPITRRQKNPLWKGGFRRTIEIRGPSMSAEIIIAEWPKNSRETLRVRLDHFKDQAIVYWRAWYEASDGTMKPGRCGLTVSIRHLPALASALANAVEAASAAGLLTVQGGPE